MIESFGQFTQAQTTKVLEKYKCFFAFSTKQFNEQKIEGIEYVSLGSGLIVPTENVDAFLDETHNNNEISKKEYLEKYGKLNIIKMELANHEAYYTRDIEDTYDEVKSLGISLKGVQKVFNAGRL